MANPNESKALAKGGKGGEVAAPVEGELVKGKGSPEQEVIDTLSPVAPDMSKELESMLGFKPSAPVELVKVGGVTKWVNFKGFMKDPNVGDNKPSLGNGRMIAGLLLGREDMPDDDNKDAEIDPDTGKKVRYFYPIRLARPCPITYKDEANQDVFEDAPVKDIVALGERYSLHELRGLAEDVTNGAIVAVMILPQERIRTGNGNRTMWTFTFWKQILKEPRRPRATKPTPTPNGKSGSTADEPF